MNKQETNKIETQHKSQNNLEDLPVDEAQQDEVKGGPLYLKMPPMELKGE